MPAAVSTHVGTTRRQHDATAVLFLLTAIGLSNVIIVSSWSCQRIFFNHVTLVSDDLEVAGGLVRRSTSLVQHSSRSIQSQTPRHLHLLFHSHWGILAHRAPTHHGLLIEIGAGVFRADVLAEFTHALADSLGGLDPLTWLFCRQYFRLGWISGKAAITSLHH